MVNHRYRLHRAAETGDSAECERLIELGESVWTQDDMGWIPLHWAADGGHDAVCELLIRGENPVDFRDLQGTTPLHLAVQAGHHDVCRRLLKEGAAPCRQDDQGFTAFNWAIENGDIELCQILIEAGTSPNYVGFAGTPALHQAVRLEHVALVGFLLDAGANLEARNSKTGCTALHVAVIHQARQACEFLLAQGADPWAKDHHGRKPADYIQEGKNDFQAFYDRCTLSALGATGSIDLNDEPILAL